MKPGDHVEVTEKDHFRFGQVGIVIGAPDQEVFYVEFKTLGNLFYCCEWIESRKLRAIAPGADGPRAG